MTKHLLLSSLTTMMLAITATAQASEIKIETGYSLAGTQSSAFAYQSVVDAAIASPGAGYGSTLVDSYDNISNAGLFGMNSGNFAFKSTVSFAVAAGNAGLWQIRSGVDFGSGGAIFVDGTAYDFKSHDMWWAGNYDNSSQSFTISLDLAAGQHVLNIYGLEQCCDGGQQAQFKAYGSDSFTTFSSHDGLAAAVPEPETYAMMLTGLGLIGFSSLRKRKSQFASAAI